MGDISQNNKELFQQKIEELLSEYLTFLRLEDLIDFSKSIDDQDYLDEGIAKSTTDELLNMVDIKSITEILI